MRSLHLYMTVAALVVAACSSDEIAAPPTSRFELKVATLSLDAVKGASYGIAVKSSHPAPNDLVWVKSGITSGDYGDGVGAISYVGPCDASAGANPHRIELVLESLTGASGNLIAANTYINPAPAGTPVVVTADCIANQDALVEINLTIMRNATQGFFDVAVNFEDVFCSAKLDCRNDDGPLKLLFDPADGERKSTVVMGFACTSGAGEPTWLHLSDAEIVCDGAQPMYFDPSGTPGNNGPLGLGPSFFQTAIYRGVEDLPGYNKCYWNAAFGINLGVHTRNCRLRASGTASATSYRPSGATPALTISPYIAWDVRLTDNSGALLCGKHPLNGPDGGVAAAYTSWTGATFKHELECARDATVESTRLECAGSFPGGARAVGDPGVEGISVTIGGVRSPTYGLPDGYVVGNDASCCTNPCCSTN